MKSVLLACFLVMCLMLVSAPAANAAVTFPIDQTTATGERIVGNFELQRVVARGDQLLAIGRLTATITTATGQVINLVRNATALLTPSQASCEILSLTLGPIDLNVLGLRIQTNQINLLITAEPGPGNLLGNLLCAVANLLNGGGPLQQLANLLNQIINALG